MFRFIPADAGNIKMASPVMPENPVHPRRCGEHTKGSQSVTQRTGSSPQMRGTSTRARSFLQRNRFIPADAGNIPSRSNPSRSNPVHPRRCGEHTKIKLLNLQMFFNCKIFTNFAVDFLFNYQRAMPIILQEKKKPVLIHPYQREFSDFFL